MKLSKESLHEILFEASMSIYDDAYKAGVALENDTLEIEGYERSEWTRLDPDDPKTYPPKNTVVLAMIRKELSGGATKKMSVEVFNEYHMPNWLGGTFTHWRPRPEAPTESEAKNEAE